MKKCTLELCDNSEPIPSFMEEYRKKYSSGSQKISLISLRTRGSESASFWLWIFTLPTHFHWNKDLNNSGNSVTALLSSNASSALFHAPSSMTVLYVLCAVKALKVSIVCTVILTSLLFWHQAYSWTKDACIIDFPLFSLIYCFKHSR